MSISLMLIQCAVAVCKLTPATAAIRHFATHSHSPGKALLIGTTVYSACVSSVFASLFHLHAAHFRKPRWRSSPKIAPGRHDALVHQLKRFTELRSLVTCTVAMSECVMAESHIDCSCLHDLGGPRSTGRDISTDDTRPYMSVTSAAKRGPERTLLP